MNEPYTVDNNTVKWSGFYKTEELAQKCLEEKVAIFAAKKRIVSAKKELQIRRPNNELAYKLKEQQRPGVTDNMLLYKFTIVLAPKDISSDK